MSHPIHILIKNIESEELPGYEAFEILREFPLYRDAIYDEEGGRVPLEHVFEYESRGERLTFAYSKDAAVAIGIPRRQWVQQSRLLDEYRGLLREKTGMLDFVVNAPFILRLLFLFFGNYKGIFRQVLDKRFKELYGDKND